MTDHGLVQNAQVQLQRAAKALERMALELALAKQVKEYDSDRRKQALATAMRVYLDQGESAAAAECKARAGDFYANKLAVLGEQYKSALETIEQADASRVMFESARSLLSVERAKIGLL